jgi:hypothetical protein
MRLRLPCVLALLAALAGCGGSSSGALPQPKVGAARTFALAHFEPSGPVTAGRPTVVSFSIRQPSGRTLTAYKRGLGPHTGVHLIIVRDDLATIIHRHPPIAADGSIRESVTFPAPGPYRVLVDTYPRLGGSLTNFQLFGKVTVRGAYRRRPLPAPTDAVTADGYRFGIRGLPHLRAIDPAFMTVDVRRPNGSKATFTPWFGALAHAIFFRKGSLDYFHTHVCGPAAPNCASIIGSTRITGHSSSPGVLRVGVLLPLSGTWRLFLQTKVDGRVLTAPFTLHVT